MTATVSMLTPMTAPALFLGIQPGFDNQAAIELYVLVSPVGPHPIGSTVSRQTLERHGYRPHIDYRAGSTPAEPGASRSESAPPAGSHRTDSAAK